MQHACNQSQMYKWQKNWGTKSQKKKAINWCNNNYSNLIFENDFLKQKKLTKEQYQVIQILVNPAFIMKKLLIQQHEICKHYDFERKKNISKNARTISKKGY